MKKVPVFFPVFLAASHACSAYMRPIPTDDARSVVCVSVCVSDTRMYCAKTAEPIDMPFEGQTQVDAMPFLPVAHFSVAFFSVAQISVALFPLPLLPFTHILPREGERLRAHCNVPRYECIPHFWSPRGATRRRCGLLPHYLVHLVRSQCYGLRSVLSVG